MKAIMLEDVSLLGTSLELKKGDRVIATPATNLPDKTQFFVRPLDCVWRDNIKRGRMDSILVPAASIKEYVECFFCGHPLEGGQCTNPHAHE